MKIICNNKRAYHDFFVSDVFEAGIVLEGSEVKSVRAGGISINESFVYIKDGELFLKNAYIKPYGFSSSFTPDSRRTRKLLMHKSQIVKLERMAKVKGMTLIPIKVYLNGAHVKIEIGVAKGKKLFDKRDSLKELAVKREIERARKTV